jgi:DnaJ-domain-containing protein 1
MTQTETQAIVTLSLMAAFVDGDKHDRERAEVRRIAEGWRSPARCTCPRWCRTC